jgi:Protein of unknown function (DUF3800)
VRIAYADETYTDAVYSFAAVLVDEERDAAMQREVLSIPGRFDSHGVDSEAELHGADLFHSRRDWKALRDQPALRVHAYRLGLRLIEACGGKVVLVSVHRTGEAANDLSVARVQAVDLLLGCLEKESRRLGDRCLLIFDTAGSTDPALVAAVHAHHRKELLNGSAPRIVEAPGIAHSHQTPGIQVADLVAFLFQRRRREKDSKSGASGQAIEALWKILEPSIICQIEPPDAPKPPRGGFNAVARA